MEQRSVFFLSDHTGITIEQVAESLLAQFQGIDFKLYRIPFISNLKQAEQAREKILQETSRTAKTPLVFSSLTNAALRNVIQSSQCDFFDLFAAFIKPMEHSLGKPATVAEGRVHSMINHENYRIRIDAVNYSLDNDDGSNISHYDKADLIVIGVSRSGKTPTCLYMALQFGIYVANYPLTDTDFDTSQLPKAIKAFRKKVFGLTIDAERLRMIRGERLPDSRYAASDRCREEVSAAEEIFHMQRIPFLNTTALSIEEIATKIMEIMQLQRRKH